MVYVSWKQALLCALPAVVAQSSSQADGLTTTAGSKTISSAVATVNGSPTTYSVAFTVPAEADIGPKILPNIYDTSAKQAQSLCPGYKASNVKKTSTGMTASLSLAGSAVSLLFRDLRKIARMLMVCSAMCTAQIFRICLSVLRFSPGTE